MATKRDYYEILGINKDATKDEIKSAFRKNAMKYHPDKNPGNKESEEKFKELTEAYEVLANEEKRKMYDRYGHAGVEGAGFDPFSGFSNVDDIFSEFSDIFSSFFGGGYQSSRNRSSKSRAKRGRDLVYEMDIEMREAAFGMEKTIELNKKTQCSSCHGSGVASGHKPETCPVCQGSGQQISRQGFFTVSTTCSRCQGQGQINTHPCPACKGSGLVNEKKNVKIKIPKGVDNDTKLKIGNEGEAGINGGSNGDLFILLKIKPDKHFSRKGPDLYCKVSLHYHQIILGDDIFIKTIYDKDVKLKIPALTKSGTMFRIRHEGIYDIHEGIIGDLYVQVDVKIPERLSFDEQNLIEKLKTVTDDLSIECKPL